MATGKVEHSAPGEVQASPIATRNNASRAHDIVEKGKQLVSHIRSPSHRSNPFLITDRHDEKQLCISSRSLQLNDFNLLKTLGTG